MSFEGLSVLMKIILTPEDLYLATSVANARMLSVGLKGSRDSVWEKPWVESYVGHLRGCMGELACSRAILKPWPARVDKYKTMPDLDPNIEVRARSDNSYGLIVRESDPDDAIFIHVVVEKSNVVDVVGWLRGKDTKIDAFWKNHGGYGYAWFVPKEFLKPLEMLN